jgi:Ca2+-binding EF-hand superfamily protein
MKKPLLTAFLFAACLLVPVGLLAAETESARAKAFAKYDANKNGKLDVEEYAAVRTDFAAKPKGALARLDTNHDGMLSDEEIAAFAPAAKKGAKSEADRVEKKAKRAEKKK